MLTKFWEGLGGGLADRFLGRLFTPALLFWAIGALAWLSSSYGPGGPTQIETQLRSAVATVEGLSGTLQLAALVAAAFLLIASALAAEQLTLPLLRVLEGYYWPSVLGTRLRDREYARRERLRARWTTLVKAAIEPHPAPDSSLRLSAVEEALRRLPSSRELTMPTRLGNVLRAAEERPNTRYGLDVAVCWPMLWLLIDKDAREAVDGARGRLNASVTLLLWAVLSLVWTALAWWVLPVALAIALALYYVPVLSAAQVYGDLMGSVFDLHRTRLYSALRWPPPSTPAGEAAAGSRLTAYLWRGTAPAGLAFDVPGASPADGDPARDSTGTA